MPIVYQLTPCGGTHYRTYYSTNNYQQWWSNPIPLFEAPAQYMPGAVPVHRFGYDQSQHYIGWRFVFSTSKHHLNFGWKYDGIAFYAFNSKLPNTIPIYGYHKQQKDGWNFTLSTSCHIGHGWIPDGVSFWAYPIH